MGTVFFRVNEFHFRALKTWLTAQFVFCEGFRILIFFALDIFIAPPFYVRCFMSSERCDRTVEVGCSKSCLHCRRQLSEGLRPHSVSRKLYFTVASPLSLSLSLPLTHTHTHTHTQTHTHTPNTYLNPNRCNFRKFISSYLSYFIT